MHTISNTPYSIDIGTGYRINTLFRWLNVPGMEVQNEWLPLYLSYFNEASYVTSRIPYH